MDPYRHERVSESIREELEELISYEMSDPRIGSLTITEVLVSPDYRQAHVRLEMVGSDVEQRATLEALSHAKQFLRHQLTARLQLFRTPDLHFEAALPGALGAKASQILKRIKRGRPRPEKNRLYPCISLLEERGNDQKQPCQVCPFQGQSRARRSFANHAQAERIYIP